MSQLPERLAFTVRELREILPIGGNASYRLARQIGRRHGGKLLVPRAALERWLEEREGETPNTTAPASDGNPSRAHTQAGSPATSSAIVTGGTDNGEPQAGDRHVRR